MRNVCAFMFAVLKHLSESVDLCISFTSSLNWSLENDGSIANLVLTFLS